MICSKSNDLEDLASQYRFKYTTPPIERKISLWNDIKSIRVICHYIRENKIDIVVGHSPKGALLSMIAAVLCGVKKRIYFRHGLVYETSRGIKRTILKMVDRITSACATTVVCVSPSLMQKSIEDHLCEPSKQVILGKGTCGGIDTQNKYNPDKIDEDRLGLYCHKYGIELQDFIVGFTGRLVRDKGIIELIQAFDLLPKEMNAKLLLVGMFEQRDALPTGIKERILNDERIIYTGQINEDMEYFYAMMNVYVLPSYREGFPIGILEAQAMRLPVLTTTETGCIDAIIDDKTGLYITHDPTNMAQKIRDIREYTQMGNVGREWVTKNYDQRIIWKYIEELYRA